MAESVFSVSSTQDPKPITSKAFEKSRPRRKARRSCSNCQRAHKTCGNERPCNQCVKRGIGLSCVDGNRKPPKYLLCDLEKPAPSPRISQGQMDRITHSCLKPTGDDLAFAEFIDPTLLHAESPSSGLENQATMRLYWDDTGNTDPVGFAHKTQSPQSEQDSSPKTPEDTDMCGGGILAESVRADLFQRQIPDGDDYDGRSHGGIHGRRPSYGISISSGWSDTFFPCGMDEEAEAARKMARSVEYELALL